MEVQYVDGEIFDADVFGLTQSAVIGETFFLLVVIEMVKLALLKAILAQVCCGWGRCT